MSLEILAKLRELADKGIADVKEAIGYLEKELEDVAAVEPAPEVAPVAETIVEPAPEVAPVDETIVEPVAPTEAPAA